MSTVINNVIRIDIEINDLKLSKGYEYLTDEDIQSILEERLSYDLVTFIEKSADNTDWSFDIAGEILETRSERSD